jgi:sugar phosphate isomerase/epimerase
MQSRKPSSWPKNPKEMTSDQQQQRVKQEADRLNALVKLAAPYGSKIEIYNHNGWYGLVENELAVIARLEELGVTDVGIVYNFSHARDDLHNDSINFPALWKTIQPHVVAVNITGMGPIDQIIYPSQGAHELEMMRTIQTSGWNGPIGLIAEKGGDAEVTLKGYITGLDWLAAEIKQPGSGGLPPFPPVP